jgi:bifunctional UDP-N-acetylglucosamine pyrophosphorylase/glucosamine-1-phosphate N-acetyltransferase
MLSFIPMRIFGAVLAAGKGERMKLPFPKTLLPVLGCPMIAYPLEALRRAGIAKPLIITRPEMVHRLKDAVGPASRFVLQPQVLGTADAVSRLKPAIMARATLVVINGDALLFESAHIRFLLSAHAAAGADVTFATAVVDDPRGLGRVVRDPSGRVTGIIEEAVAGTDTKQIKEINAGLYAFEAPAIFSLISSIRPAGSKREKYLTTAVELAIARGLKVATVTLPPDACLGINTLAEAAQARAILQSRKLAALMAEGVIVDDPASVTVDWDAFAGPGTRILPGTMLLAGTRAGRDCVLGPNSVIRGARIGDQVTVESSYVTDSRLENGVSVGPFAHVRPGCTLRKGAELGTHAEIVRTTLGEKVRMHHFSYMGDAIVGDGVNIGAGAISANYDGKRKHPTRIGRNAFIGSGSILVAPAIVGEGALVGAGTVVPGGRKVAPHSIVVGVPARELKGRKHGK